MQIKVFPTNLLGVNCYVLYGNNEALMVDPAGAKSEVLEFLKEHDLALQAIINTHGHADHILGNAWFKEQTKVPLWIHSRDQAYLQDDSLSLATWLGIDMPQVQADRLLEDGDILKVGGQTLEVLHTPGHSPGSICLYWSGGLISGDTLFLQSVGRTDLPGGDKELLAESLARIAMLPQETLIYPGHGPSTTLVRELKENPFLCRYQKD